MLSIPRSNTPQLCSINCNTPRAAAAAACVRIKASMVDDSSAKRMERAWLISKQPSPVSCSSCQSNGHVDCKWCGGTGFFIIGDNMLCQVPSRNTSCVICAGKGSTRCSDCKGTGFRAKWLEEPPVHK
ncbi:Tsi1-interacting protein TSIP1 [Heracleum sosnowskyi]|uniref:Tsi1-interacting protein TSIP1 n=1 Tax=Heracleum sosnowskyi TaxID=360622 RepID=A0AAD8HU77_9APIA|nr:Tsi1-interacting protein TSIP1 [Heracleum sosnowskyi]